MRKPEAKRLIARQKMLLEPFFSVVGVLGMTPSLEFTSLRAPFVGSV